MCKATTTTSTELYERQILWTFWNDNGTAVKHCWSLMRSMTSFSSKRTTALLLTFCRSNATHLNRLPVPPASFSCLPNFEMRIYIAYHQVQCDAVVKNHKIIFPHNQTASNVRQHLLWFGLLWQTDSLHEPYIQRLWNFLIASTAMTWMVFIEYMTF